MDIISRLNRFVKQSGRSSSQFADEVGIPRPSFSQILNGRNRKISNEVIEKIHTHFPELNILWLLFGDGDMVIDNKSVLPYESLEYLGKNVVEPSLFETDHPVRTKPVDTQESSTKPSSKTKDKATEEIKQNTEANDVEKLDADQNASDLKNVLPNHLSEILRKDHPIESNSKTITAIMVYYDDNTYDIFRTSKL